MKPSVFTALEKSQDGVFQKIHRLEQVLGKLRYEGKLQAGKNMGQIGAILDFFGQDLVRHLREEEKYLFPYVEVHIPRLSPMVSLLCLEHEELLRTLWTLRRALRRLRSAREASRRLALLDELRQKGTYWIYLLRSHMRLERENLYRVADRELSQQEKSQLVGRICKKGGGT